MTEETTRIMRQHAATNIMRSFGVPSWEASMAAKEMLDAGLFEPRQPKQPEKPPLHKPRKKSAKNATPKSEAA
jgi:hypothetical protein